METPGRLLRNMRERLGLSLRDVESASLRIAEKHARDDFILHPGRVSQIETTDDVPSIFKLYSLAAVYQMDFREILNWYGVDLQQFASDIPLSEIDRSHLVAGLGSALETFMPIRMDPAFELNKTSNLGRLVLEWGNVPTSFLSEFAGDGYSYGFVGLQDFTMYPLIRPGSFIQIDEKRNTIVEKPWKSELDRPIFFIEMRDEFVCAWCSMQGSTLVLQPHPLSGLSPRIFRHPQDAEVIGQVVGVAMRLVERELGDGQKVSLRIEATNRNASRQR